MSEQSNPSNDDSSAGERCVDVDAATSSCTNNNKQKTDVPPSTNETFISNNKPVGEEELINEFDDTHEDEDAPPETTSLLPTASISPPAAGATIPPVEPPAPPPTTRRRRSRFHSLARARTTPWLVTILVPLLCILAHYIFYYGQTRDMWKLRLFAHIDTWANATEYKTRRAFDAAGLDYKNHITYDKDEDVETFTYWYAIKQLWKAKKMPNLWLPRMAAVLLVIFSGVWPHLKLLLLNITFLLPVPIRSRSRMLHWLSCLGKWSLADVLTVCVMVGVLHLDWTVDPDAIKNGVIEDLPLIMTLTKSVYSYWELCDMLLHMDCNKQKRVDKVAKCKACHALVRDAFEHPDWSRKTGKTIVKGIKTGGGGSASLRVVGMTGIYAFCAAVISSILLSCIVDYYDHIHKQDMIEQRRLARNREAVNNDDVEVGDDQNLREPLMRNPLEVDQQINDLVYHRGRWRPRDSVGKFGIPFMIFGFVSLVTVLLAVNLPSMERVVHGAGPQLLHEILGVNWERTYSLQSLMSVTGAAGGWDNLLMSTFSLFCVFGPIARAAMLLVCSFMDTSDALRKFVGPMTTLINFIGGFCSWEVFAIAIVMVDMLMPSITNTIIHKPICKEVSDDGSCLQVEFNILQTSFQWIVIGGVILLSTSWVAVRQGGSNDHDELLDDEPIEYTHLLPTNNAEDEEEV
jgi:hypothetical protein